MIRGGGAWRLSSKIGLVGLIARAGRAVEGADLDVDGEDGADLGWDAGRKEDLGSGEGRTRAGQAVMSYHHAVPKLRLIVSVLFWGVPFSRIPLAGCLR